jgi:acetyltransferase
MDVHKLEKIFKPKRIALIGVTMNPNSVGGKVLTNLISGGFRGVVYPVNPDYEAVLGIQCYPDVYSLPKTPDLGIICTPAEKVPDVVRACGERGILGLIIMSAGFKEAGAEGAALEEQVKAERSRFDGMRIIGPNCLGIIAPKMNLNASFSSGMPRPGNVAFISQSGALCTSVLDWAAQGKIGFSYFVSIGNTVDVDFGDLIDYFGEDEQTKSMILYIESISDVRKFMSASRPFARNKPIIVYKAGRFPESAEVAASHTGAMASEDAVYDAAFQRVGLARVFDIGDIFNVAELVGRNRTPKGPNLGIITNAGGPGVMATDALIAARGKLAKLSEETLEALNEMLPPMWSHGNPVDVLGDARAKRIARAAEVVIKDKGVDAALVILTPQAMTDPTATAKAIANLAESTSKPILAAWLGGESMVEGLRILNDAGVSSYQTPEQAVRAFMTLVSYARNLESLYETPRDVPVEFSLNRASLREKYLAKYFNETSILPEDASKALLDAYGIPTTQPYPAGSVEEAVEITQKLGYPVVLKIFSPDITHKTDVHGVELDIRDENMVRGAYARIIENAARLRPDAQIDGVTVQRMVHDKNAIEMIIGIKKDNIFGTVIMAGMGGTGAELFADRSLGFPPLNERLARQMLESLKIWPLLNGYRGSPPLNLDQLIEVLIRLSYLAADYPEIMELDINPLLVTPESVAALDARIVIDPSLVGKNIKPYSHLALHPYPEKYVKTVILPDGTEILFRPIKPEDEPLWLAFLASCSKESIYSRFRYAFHWNSHDVAARYCYIDYDREIGIVAEINQDGNRQILGIGRLIADPDHETVEYAVLIADAWQARDLGSMLTDYCLDIAMGWDLKKVVAITTKDNHRMLAVLRKRGFRATGEDDGSEVYTEKVLSTPDK